MGGNKLRDKLIAGDRVKMINPHHVSDSLSGRLIAHGADAIFVDCEHGSWAFEDVRTTVANVRLAGGNVVVRPQNHDRSLIIRYVNCGATGIMVPMVGNAAEATAIVDAVRYANPLDDGGVLIVCMIENEEVIDSQLEAMLDVQGIDVFFFGPTDITQSMGLMPPRPGEDWQDRVKDKIKKSLDLVTSRGKFGGTLVRDDNVREFADAGASYLYLHTDPFLRQGFERFNQALSA